MSKTRLANVEVGKEDHIARWMLETAQAFCHLCGRYLHYFDYDIHKSNNYQLAISNLEKHIEENHGETNTGH